MGVVYEAYDHERRAVVALKTLRQAEPHALVRFKNEFRALADLTHPNLVALDELFSAKDQWFFTMEELIRGVAFLDWVRPREGAAAGFGASGQWGGDAPSGDDETLDTVPPDGDPTDATSPGRGSVAVIAAHVLGGFTNFDRVRAATAQLALGVHALHQAGRLHRDLKPSNVLVEEGGRVVVCDFGLVSELGRDETGVGRAHDTGTHERRVAGTVAYMSPEQAGNRPLTEASDWYAVGVMLFHALAGRLPFTGDQTAVMHMKQFAEPPDLTVFAPTAPAPLVDLVKRLLARDPAERPSGGEVLDDGARGDGASGASSPSVGRAVFVGREQQVAALWRAFADTRDGNCRAVFLRGRSGMGKTSIANRFLAGVREGAQALVLAGRCYERESMPYKALDGIIDALTQHLVKLPAREVEPLVPASANDLNRLFPVLKRVTTFGELAAADTFQADPQVVRRRAFQALRALVTQLAVRSPLILFIDDLQWADADGVALLAEVMRPPGPGRVMLLGTYREEDAESPRIVTLRDELGPQLEEVAVGPLSSGEADALARSLLGRAPSQAHVASVALESGGSPLFVAELAHYARSHESLETSISLETALKRRIHALSPAAREILQVVSVAGRPVPREVVRAASRVGDDESRALAALQSDHLVRTTRQGDEQVVETYHDRIRETAVDLLDAEQLAGLHRRLAHALDAAGRGSSEAAAEHWLGAGEVDMAARLAIEVAREAVAALAFDRAARLFRLALVNGSHDPLERSALLFELGDALALTGRAPEGAADAYLEAASHAGAEQALEARRRAANELLRSGHITRGLAVLKDVLAAIGMELSPTPFHAIRSLLWRRAQLRMRGMQFVEKPAAEVSPEALRLVDTTWSVSRGLGIVDNIRGAVFQSVNLVQALGAGDAVRASRALGMEACYLATTGAKGAERARKLLVRSRELAEKSAAPNAIGNMLTAHCVVSYLDGRWRLARDFGIEASRLLSERGMGMEWERTTAELFSMMGRLFIGELPPVFAEFPDRLREAVEKQDLYTATNLRTRVGYLVFLARNEIELADEEVRRAREEWSYPGVHMQHYFQLCADSQIRLYAAEPRTSLEAIDSHWKPFEKAFLLRIGVLQMVLRDVRGRAAVAAAAGKPRDVGRLLSVAAGDARWLLKGKVAASRPLGALIMAGRAARVGQDVHAMRWLTEAEGGFDAAEMGLHRQVTRWRRGQLLGGEGGAELRKAAESWMRERGIHEPLRFGELLAPGF